MQDRGEGPEGVKMPAITIGTGRAPQRRAVQCRKCGKRWNVDLSSPGPYRCSGPDLYRRCGGTAAWDGPADPALDRATR